MTSVAGEGGSGSVAGAGSEDPATTAGGAMTTAPGSSTIGEGYVTVTDDTGTTVAGPVATGAGGTYQVDVTTRGGCSGLDRPLVQVTPVEPRLVSVSVPSCESVGWRFYVDIRQADAPFGLTDGDWQFVMFG